MIVITGFGKPNSLGSNIARAILKANPTEKIIAVSDERIPIAQLDSGFHALYPTDLSDPQSWDELAEFLLDYPIHGLVNCAGMNHMDWIENISYEQYSKVMRLNLDAPIFLTKAVDSMMEEGFVLNICSMGARKAFRTSMPYNVSKAALVMATKQMGRELYPDTGNVIFGISPNQIEGSGMTNENETEILNIRGWDKAQADEYRRSGMLVKEDTSLDQVSSFIGYLLSDRKNYIQFCGMEIQYGD